MAMIAYFSEIDNSISENGIDNNGKIFNKKNSAAKICCCAVFVFFTLVVLRLFLSDKQKLRRRR